MITKIIWPYSRNKENPFGGINGFRNLRITFHSGSFSSSSQDETKALEILYGLAGLDDIDALSFDGEIYPKIVFGVYADEKEFVDFQVKDQNNNISVYGGTPTTSINNHAILRLTGMYSPKAERETEITRQDLLKAETHYSLHRDIFVTLSPLLLENRETLKYCNIHSPTEALKIVSLYLRTRKEFEWISDIKGDMRYLVKRQWFYQLLSRGLLPSSWRYISSLGLHKNREELVTLGWSIIERFSRALQARDEIARLFYLPDTQSSEDQKSYHFDYLTLLLTAALDAQALIINKVYQYGLKDINCGLRRDAFIKAARNDKNIENVLNSNKDLINILFKLRNKIHSNSLKTDYYFPVSYPDDLLDAIYQYNPSNHWGIQKEKVSLIENNKPPVSSFNYSIDLYTLACCLIDETCKLIDTLMDETKIENFLDQSDLAKVIFQPPADMVPYILSYLLLA